MNAALIMKLMSAKNEFSRNHPKFEAFMNSILSREMEVGTVIEVSVTRPGEAPVTTNLKVQQSDLELLAELKELAK